MKRRTEIKSMAGQCSHCRRRNEMQRITNVFISGRQAVEWRCLHCGAYPAKPVS